MKLDADTIKTIAALLGILAAAIGGGTAVNATAERDAALERSREEIRRDIDWGYNMCISDGQRRIARGEERVLPNVPHKRIERLANEAAEAE